ncbi:hypothetical protein TELCIR_00910 [Teladorsagia circumcincta]|uniref:Amiloride-sensitive sodium channel n=1 Tax=Teladorsagia circumcincta TaxID=45464 RepID=A0A2G9V3E0_TELCI|nr:hypothetical protein TELCIR_00910 [Teladorsagia circumcincta]
MFVVTVVALFFTYYVLVEYLAYQTITHLTVIQNDSLLLPSIHVCPKNPDHLNYEVLFADIEQRVGSVTFDLKRDILLYFIAACGFLNTKVETWSATRIWLTEPVVDQWIGNRSMVEMFQFVFDGNGIQCDDVSNSNELVDHSCSNLSVQVFSDCVMMKCCAHFKPHYVMLRGSAGQMLNKVNQSKYSVVYYYAKNYKQICRMKIQHKTKRQYAIYFGDQWPEIAIFPRIYVTKDEFVLANVGLRKVKMMPRTDVCSIDPHSRGRATCYVNRWLEENLLNPLNCTLPAMRDLRSAKGYEVCSPHVVIANYRQIITAYTLQNRCDPNCDRWDQGFQYWTSVEKNLGVFRLDVFYGDLSYEEYEEIAMLSYPGFISQIGGQLGLFLDVRMSVAQERTDECKN